MTESLERLDGDFFNVERPLEGYKTEVDLAEWKARVMTAYDVGRDGYQELTNHSRPEPEPLVTSRNNSDGSSKKQVFRVPRPYVQMCAKASLGLFQKGGRVVFKPLMCGSWSCPHCRRVLAARILDRLRRGLEARRESHLTFVTLTLDPSKFGAFVVGWAYWDENGEPSDDPKQAARRSRLWSSPTFEQFAEATAAMQRECERLYDRLNSKARRAGLQRFGYFRVVELHRNGWPHYHVVLEHPELACEDIQRQLSGWTLGRWDARPIDIDGAVGEVAPYLVCNERKASGHKAYQFAATALPKNFRLYSPSQDFLAPPETSKREKPEHSLVLRGHFTSFKKLLESFGQDLGAKRVEGESSCTALQVWKRPERLIIEDEHPDFRWVCPPPSDDDHKPVSGLQATGDAAVLLYSELAHQQALHAPPEWFRQLRRVLFPVPTASSPDEPLTTS